MSRSSFARSFFQSGEGEAQFADEDAAIAAAAAAIGGGDTSMDSTVLEAGGGASPDRNRGGMDRRRSRRRLSRGSGRSSRDIARSSAAAAATASPGRENSATSSTSGSATLEEAPMPPRPEAAKRQNSWYRDALLQGGASQDLAAILGEEPPSAGDDGAVINNEEVLEQYRIMAHVEASIRVKENTGFDISDYERRRKMHPEPKKGDYYTGSNAPKPKLPPPKRITPGSAGRSLLMKPKEPDIPPINPSFPQNVKRVPELCPGVVMQGSAALPKGEHAVRCLGCQTKLRVNLLAMLVQCPDCSTVSPASSTRR